MAEAAARATGGTNHDLDKSDVLAINSPLDHVTVLIKLETPWPTTARKTSADVETEIERRAMRRIRWRLVPFCMLLFVVNYLDRVNVSFASLQMNQTLGLTPQMFGFAAGIFFAGYVLLELPSNLVLQRVGARRWIARIMVTWGLVCCATVFVRGPVSLDITRFLLGAAEAGFFPGILLYFTTWFPRRHLGRTVAGFMTATAIANLVGAPVSAALLGLDGAWGLRGWQWLFLLEGVPAILLAPVTLAVLADSPRQAAWLPEDERTWLLATLDQERAEKRAAAVPFSLRGALREPQLYILSALCFFLVAATFGLVLWLPQIVRGLGVTSLGQIALISASPYILAAPAMVYWGLHSDRAGERRWHAAGAMLLGAAGLALGSMVTSDVTLSFVALCVAAIGIWSSYGAFWAMPNAALSGTAAAGGLALVNSFGNIGAFLSPVAIGWARERTGTFAVPLLLLAASLVLASVLALLTARPAFQASAFGVETAD